MSSALSGPPRAQAKAGARVDCGCGALPNAYTHVYADITHKDYVARLKTAFGVTPPAYEDRERAGRLQDALAKAEVERETMNARLQELKLGA
jgi:hypothetical protein